MPRYESALNTTGLERPAVIQGVHMVFGADWDKPWRNGEGRETKDSQSFPKENGDRPWRTSMVIAIGQAKTLDNEDWQVLWWAIADLKTPLANAQLSGLVFAARPHAAIRFCRPLHFWQQSLRLYRGKHWVDVLAENFGHCGWRTCLPARTCQAQ